MSVEISLAQFNRIASGDYNAGQIDIKTGKNGPELVKINNHVWKASKNNVMLSPERILEVKEAFLDALQKAAVPKAKMTEIRARLGLPEEMDVATGKEGRAEVLKARYTPLSRALARELLDKYACYGKGYTPESARNVSYEDYQAAMSTAKMSASNAAKRDSTNLITDSKYIARGDVEGTDRSIADAMSLLSATRDLGDIEAARNNRITGGNAVNEKEKQHTILVNSFQSLVAAALKMLPASERESGEFRLAGETVKLVKDGNGAIHALVGKGNLATKVNLKMDADTFIARLLGRAVANMDVIGDSALKNILNSVYDNDLQGGLVAGEKASRTRQLSSLILVNKSGGKVDIDALIGGKYNTGILEEMAERAIAGEDVGDCKAKLDAYHAKLYNDNSNLPEEMKAMLGNVANVPLEKPGAGDGEFVVRAPIAGDIGKVVQAMPPQEPVQVPKELRDIGGVDGVKNFVADLVFSDDTMVGDSVIGKIGESMRKTLTNGKNIVALAEIIKNPAILNAACAPQIADAVAEGFGKMAKVIGEAFEKATGRKLADAAKEPDFAARLADFMKDPGKMPGAELSKFDDIILAMAGKGCEKIQEFINKDVFKVDAGNVNSSGALVNAPYENLSAKEIGKQLDAKGLNEILDAASNSDSPGQVGFFRQVISNYFTSLGKADKRSCFSAALKYSQSFDFGELKGKELDSAKAQAVNKFTGAILKGTSPLLQKMMQGLPKEIMGGYADALDDMKSSLAPIPRKIVQAHFMQMIKDSNEGFEDKGAGAKAIKSIELVKSLGAASVGEAFLCKFTYLEKVPRMETYTDPQDNTEKKRPALDKNGKPVFDNVEKTADFVVKIMRHDAERRVKAEAEIFTAAAKKIGPGMAKTWEGQLKQYMTEFDFRNEAANVEEGVKLYDIGGSKNHPLQPIAKHVHSMKLSTIVPAKKDVMVAEVAIGKPVDKFFKESISAIRTAASSIFEQDPATGRIKWVDGPVDPKTNKPKKVPVFKQNVSGGAINNMIEWARNNYSNIKDNQKMLVEATKAWFHEALLGSGKFHGDTHAGNLMVKTGQITFIDFGNLYELKSEVPLLDENGNAVLDPATNKPKTINERHELLRVIMGAAFRDKTFILEGFEKLLSPAGKAALKANRDKAEAILDSILKKGRFSYDMVYRLNAAVSELQKLGLELPPQINCFVQSMARLSNSLSEMNTIVNQTSLLLEAADDYVNPNPPPQQRDELDILGMAFDYRTTAEGRTKVADDNNAAGVTVDGKPVDISSFFHRMTDDVGFGGISFSGEDLMTGGAYYKKVLDRLTKADDTLAEVRKLNSMLRANLDVEHNDGFAQRMDILEGELYKKLEDELKAAEEASKAKADKKDGEQQKTDPEKADGEPVKTPTKEDAIKHFAMQYTSAVKYFASAVQNNEELFVTMRTYETVEKPSSFANAVMTTMMDNFDALSDTFADSQGRLIADVFSITSGELNTGIFAGTEKRVQAIKDDALKMAGDNSYQVDIGV